LICAIDGGYNHLKKQNIQPDLITGDFDSIEHIPKNIEVIPTPDQNFTDFHKALQILHARDFLDIDIFGGTGKEQDHFLGNLSTALEWGKKIKLTFFDDFGRFFLLDKTFNETNILNHTISLIPFPSAYGICTKGLRYPLHKETLVFGERIGTRNKAVQQDIAITYEKGALFIFIRNEKT
jgi:thiamine pyrophosphokinase